ncbi:hypothetical protein AB0E69_15585 [Kribbella sp. NPDC026611]|uniref:hypothetical protein n=1 Tax=Kribbella sp. NPDC026611 TaxID=3154911 RepID=UPI0033D41A19
MTELDDDLDRLDDRQVLAVLDAVLGEVAADDTPEGESDQVLALDALMADDGQGPGLQALDEVDPVAAAAAARDLLRMFADAPETADVVREWLAERPEQEAAAVPLILAAPLVLTGCVVLLQIVGHTTFSRDSSGQWSVSYDPAKRTPFDGTVKEMVGTLSKLMRTMTGNG